ncbi:MAG: NAD(P)-dependent glycerol-3-phosphate dehydrogenase [Oscillospiraceae bacterium]|jgi:glycerol-3-phosphate dehydrogenase (NAD(P)+)|nr:NAD(P)-dependent glycerol-3-phosphate dehydrogenase [Oscillospiraceae bacterium]
MNIVVLGAGSFGLAMAIMAGKFGHNVTVWTPFEEELGEIMTYREHRKKLPNIKIPDYVKFSSGLECCDDADIVIFGVPSNVTRQVAREAKMYISKSSIIVNTSKGIEANSLKRMSEVIFEELEFPVVVLSGPSHAEEVAKGMATSVVVSCADNAVAKTAQAALNNKEFRVYRNHDVIGCELGGAFKNIIALGVGICDGLGLGDNTKAALITRGIAEIARLGFAMGAKHETFAGLTGIGDLNVTCYSMHSRNRRAGILIGSGSTPLEAVEKIGTVEGFNCCKSALGLIEKYNVSMPITQQIYDILFNNKSPRQCLEALMSRPSTDNEAEYLSVYK